MIDNMKKNKRQFKLKIERLPRALAAAILASALSAFLFTGFFGTGLEDSLMLYAMLLCALFTASIELVSLPNPVLLGGTGGFIGIICALFFIPVDDSSLYSLIKEHSHISAARLLPITLLLCGALCLAVCILNRSFVLRCITAVSLSAMVILFIWFKYTLLKIPAILIVAYILIVLCQVCSSRITASSGKPRDMWFVLFGLLSAVIIFYLPHPDTRIQWEKIFEAEPDDRLIQLGETLGIEHISDSDDEPEETIVSGYADDLSSIGGWLELVSNAKLQVAFSDNVHSDRLTGSIYDCYTGKGWLYSAEINGFGYSGNSSAEVFSPSDIHGYACITDISEDISAHKSLFYPAFTYSIMSADSGESALRDDVHMTFMDSSDSSYNVYYFKTPQKYELTSDEREAYLSLPDGLPKRIKKLALTSVSDCSDDRSKAQALMQIFSEYEYKTYVTSLPEGRDFVDYFLFDSKEGYCSYFASAMTVMARCCGIPARYVQGYYIGSGSGTSFTVSSDNAHAWAELYIDGCWMVYDPAVYPFEEITSSPTDVINENELKKDNSALKRVLLYAYIATAAAAVVFIIFRPFFRKLPWRIKTKRTHGSNQNYPVIAACGKLLWVLAACGIKRDNAETLTEFGERICREHQWLDEAAGEDVSCLFTQTCKALYSSEKTDPLPRKKVTRAVRKAYIKNFGVGKYLRGYRRASL